MSKVRINDLARELEVKSKAILDVLTLVGVTEKKTHSSSLEDFEAEKVRAHIRGSSDTPAPSARSARTLRGEEEIKTKIDLSHISRPGDVLKAITQQKEVAAPPPRPAAPPPLVARPVIVTPVARPMPPPAAPVTPPAVAPVAPPAKPVVVAPAVERPAAAVAPPAPPVIVPPRPATPPPAAVAAPPAPATPVVTASAAAPPVSSVPSAPV